MSDFPTLNQAQGLTHFVLNETAKKPRLRVMYDYSTHTWKPINSYDIHHLHDLQTLLGIIASINSGESTSVIDWLLSRDDVKSSVTAGKVMAIVFGSITLVSLIIAILATPFLLIMTGMFSLFTVLIYIGYRNQININTALITNLTLSPLFALNYILVSKPPCTINLNITCHYAVFQEVDVKGTDSKGKRIVTRQMRPLICDIKPNALKKPGVISGCDLVGADPTVYDDWFSHYLQLKTWDPSPYENQRRSRKNSMFEQYYPIWIDITNDG
eukprot:gnl/Dysnectes_brevis/6338_a9768_546.p1 GENE.gnl/Dysnectes_brevis/6338_a9768_546~~gnl/Dysnectes_brevis/6338_a9768_546.p1  ORF type:complete len:271 (+),score=-1.54 gnl/Dysnectes_brevis/6338_a9768_546:43-855(+)